MEMPVPSSALESRSAALPFEFERVRDHLARQGLSLDPTFAPRRLKGGLANVNYVVRIEDRWMVLRFAPAGELPKGAHDRVREHRVLSRLPDAFPLAPRSVLLCDDKAVAGADFQVLEFKNGRNLGRTELATHPAGDAAGSRTTEVMIDILAHLHAVDPAAVDLQALGRPGGFVERTIRSWVSRGLAVAADDDQATLIAALGGALADRIPNVARNAPTLLHCDFKLDNILFADDLSTPLAVLDWDMCTLGEPLFDLATLLSYWTEPGDPDCMHRLNQMPTEAYGFPPRAQVAEMYADASGRSVEGISILWAVCLMKLGIVFLQLDARWRDGAMGPQASSRDFAALGGDILSFANQQIR